jgi:hypothetical protein
MIRLHPGAGVIISWESDCSHQGMTVITSPEPLREPLDCDNGQPEHTCDWDCLTVHTFCPLPPVLCVFEPTAHVCTLKMVEDGLSAYSVSSAACPRAV